MSVHPIDAAAAVDAAEKGGDQKGAKDSIEKSIGKNRFLFK
jgi:hypothetical protein